MTVLLVDAVLCTFLTSVIILTPEHYSEVKKLVYEARSNWKEIGEEVGLSVEDLENIQGSNNAERLSSVVETWLRRRSLNPNLMALAKALKSKIVDREDVAGME